MSDHAAMPARPVSLFTIAFLLSIFAAFLLVIRWFYHPASTPAFVAPAENIPKDLAWRADRASRQKTLHEVREAEAKKAGSYGWVDQKAGVVELPSERAMELTVEKYGSKSSI